MALGGLATVASVVLAALGKIGWLWVASGVVLVIVGRLWQIVFKSSGLASARAAAAQVPLTLGAVVQANTRLYQPGNNDVLPAIVVYMDPTDPQALNGDMALQASAYLQQIKSQGSQDPALLALAQKMHDERSHFTDEALPPSFHASVRFRWSVTTIDSRRLPQGHLSEGQVLPFFIYGGGPSLLAHELYC
jgi:hypothetical protein